MQRAIEDGHVVRERRPLHGRPRRGDARPARASRSAPARAGRSRCYKLARCRAGAARPRLRPAGRREGDRRARARAPPDAQPELWVRRSGPRRSSRDMLETVPTPAAGPRPRRRRDRASRRAKLRGSASYAAFVSAAIVPAPARFIGRPASPRSALPFAAFLVPRARARARARAAVALTLDEEIRAVEGETVTAPTRADGHRRGTSSSWRSHSCCRAASSSPSAPTRMIVRASGRTSRARPARARAVALGRVPARRASPLRVRDRFGLVAYDARPRRAVTLRAYPQPETAARLVSPLETQPFAGNRVARDARRGDRVRRPAALHVPATACAASTGA